MLTKELDERAPRETLRFVSARWVQNERRHGDIQRDAHAGNIAMAGLVAAHPRNYPEPFATERGRTS